MTRLRFTWSEAKAASNERKHRVSFETATQAFADPMALSEQDRIEDGESRWRTIGSTGGVMILVVAHTVKDGRDGTEVIRVISARRAQPHERKRYERERHRHL